LDTPGFIQFGVIVQADGTASGMLSPSERSGCGENTGGIELALPRAFWPSCGKAAGSTPCAASTAIR
jgi:hypothetical protein